MSTGGSPAGTLWGDVTEWAAAKPNAPALWAPDTEESLSFAKLHRKVAGLAAQFSRLDCKVLAVYADNGIDWVVTDLAAHLAGICLLPLPTFFSEEQIQHALLDAGADFILTDDPQCFQARGGQAETGDYPLRLSLLRLQPGQEAAPGHDRPAGTAKITYTSGSTGAPKGVCLSGQQIEEVSGAVVAALASVRASTHLSVLPLSTLLENIAGVYVPLRRGGCVAVPSLVSLGFAGSSSLDVSRFLQMLSSSRPQSMILVPQLLEVLVQSAAQGWSSPRTLEFVAVGGGKTNPRLITQARDLGIPVFEGYGLSECGSVVTLNVPGQDRPGSVGKPLAHVRVETCDGEVSVEAHDFLGYLGAPEGSSIEAGKSSRRLQTGDLGYMDADGYLYITGRKNDMIITSYGRNLSPEWIESELQLAPDIAGSVVFGDARPWCSALIFAPAPDLTAEALQGQIDQINSRLPDYARIRRWIRLERPLSLQDGTLTANGRPRRREISIRFQNRINRLYTKDGDGGDRSESDPACSIQAHTQGV